MAERRKETKLSRAKNAVRGAFNVPKAPYLATTQRFGKTKLSPADLILGGFSQLRGEEATEFMDWVKGFPSKTVQVFPDKPVDKPDHLKLNEVTIELPLVARLSLLTELLYTRLQDLTHFVDLSSKFEAAAVVGKYEESDGLLVQIESYFGISLWSIENRIALLQRWKGLEAQKEYARSLSATARGKAAGVSSFWISQRNEESTVFSRYKARLERSITTWKIGDSLKDAYRVLFGISSFSSLTDERASSAVASLSSASLVDAYTSTVLAIEAAVLRGDLGTWPASLTSLVTRLPANDVRIRNTLGLLKGNISSLPAVETRNLDELCTGAPSNGRPSTTPDAACFFEAAMRTSCSGQASNWPAGSLANDFCALVAAAVLRNEGFDTLIEQGIKLLANTRTFTLSSSVGGLLALQLPASQAARRASLCFFIGSEFIHPLHAFALPPIVAHELVTLVFPQSVVAKKIALALERKLQPDDELHTCIREFAARVLLEDGRAVQALEFLRESDAKADDFARRRLYPLKAITHLRNGQLPEAFEATASVCAYDPEIATLLPLQELVEASLVDAKGIAPLHMAIVYDLYLERFDNADLFQRLQFAYEDYVTLQGAQRPSELGIKVDEANSAMLIFFLYRIATPQVMDVSFWLFKTSQDTLRERIAVCSQLVALDPANENQYRDEIKDITKLLSIQEGLDDVDRSRVFINLDKLSRWAEIELRESFDRYKALLKTTTPESNAGEFDRALKDFASGKSSLDRFASYPEDEQGQLLFDMFKAIAEKYLHDPDFGLDAYLSMRVRHGSLAGHIRGPLEEQGLLAVRDHGTNDYRILRQPNVEEHWALQEDWPNLRGCVRGFSRKIDASIDHLLKDKLQIRRDDKKEGLFVFDPQPLLIYYVRANFEAGSTFQDLISKVIDGLNVYLAISLQNVSNYINHDFSEAVAAHVESFEGEIANKLSPNLRSETQGLIAKVSPELQASIQRVASWFGLDAANRRRTLRTMEQIVDIAIEASNNAHRGFEPKYHRSVDDLGLQANETFLEFTDILFTVLDNIYRHSGLDSNPEIHIIIKELHTSEDDGGTRVQVSVVNKIASHVRTPAAERRLNRIKDQIESGDYRASSKVEGGTGLLKLKRLVAADNRQTLDFGYRPDTSEFFVDIIMVLVFEKVQDEA